MVKQEDLPEGWAKSVLGDVATVQSGVGFPKKYQDNPDGKLPVYKVGDVSKAARFDDGYLRTSSNFVSETDAKEMRGKIYSEGATLFAKIGEALRLNRRGYVVLPGLADNNVMGVKAHFGEQDRFLYHFLRTQDLAKFSRSTTVPSIRKGDVESIELKLPPLAEQTRIANKLDELLAQVDTIKARVDAIPGILKRFRQSVLAAAVSGRLTEEWRDGRDDVEVADKLLERVRSLRKETWSLKGSYKDPVESEVELFAALPATWACASLDVLVDGNRPICYGILMPKENLPDGVLYVKVRDMKGEVINLEGLQRTSPEIAQKYARSSLVSGDILLSIRGTYGRVVEVPEALEGGNITQDSARLAISDLVDHRYVLYALRSVPLQKHFQAVARGVAVKGVNIGDIRPTPISLPPYSEQIEIVRQIELLFAFADQAEQRVVDAQSDIDSLTQSILAKAFRGELVPQNSDDEPASVLLERIKDGLA